MKEPSASQLRVLARTAVDELTYYPSGSAWFPRGQQVNRASVAALLKSGHLEPDPDDTTTLQVTAAGREALDAHPEVARAAEQDADVRAVMRLINDATNIRWKANDTAETRSRLSTELTEALHTRGHAGAEFATLEVNPHVWREVARAAAHSLGRPVQTVIGSGYVYATLRDWPANEAERAVHDEDLRAAVQAAALHEGGPE